MVRRAVALMSIAAMLTACALPSLQSEHKQPKKVKPWPTPTTQPAPVSTTTTSLPAPSSTVVVTTTAAPAPSTTTPPTTAPATTTTTVPAPGPGILTFRSSYVPRPAGDGVGAFRHTCRPSHVLADDPIVVPGQPGASHLHQFFGNRTVDAFSTTMMTGTSTCAGGDANRSGYWVPALVDSTGSVIVARQLGVYYKSGYQGIPAARIQPLPVGLRIVSGEAMATADQHNVNWRCSGGVQSSKTIPACPAGQILTGSVNFPQCWDGVNLDSPDHKSHMAFGNGAFGCPASHPVPLPNITMNTDWLMPAGGSAGLRLSTDGAAPGRTLHADWWNGWDQATMLTWVTNCTAAGRDCGVDNLGNGFGLVF